MDQPIFGALAPAHVERVPDRAIVGQINPRPLAAAHGGAEEHRQDRRVAPGEQRCVIKAGDQLLTAA
jgi:hypothetical protein